MTALVVALSAEAKPIIENYKLQLIDSKLQVYKNETILLIISGIGKINAIIATTHLASKYNPKIFINIGIAGTKESNISIGDVFLVNKIYDIETNRYYFPDMLYKLDMSERDISTSIKPLDNPALLSTSLVDMESSGFFIAAARFVTNENIFIIKVISDYLDITIQNKETVGKLMSLTIKTLDKILLIKPISQNILDNDEIVRLEQIGLELKLSKTQSNQLKEFTIYKKLQENNTLFLDKLEGQNIQNKEQRNKLISELLNVE